MTPIEKLLLIFMTKMTKQSRILMSIPRLCQEFLEDSKLTRKPASISAHIQNILKAVPKSDSDLLMHIRMLFKFHAKVSDAMRNKISSTYSSSSFRFDEAGHLTFFHADGLVLHHASKKINILQKKPENSGEVQNKPSSKKSKVVKSKRKTKPVQEKGVNRRWLANLIVSEQVVREVEPEELVEEYGIEPMEMKEEQRFVMEEETVLLAEIKQESSDDFGIEPFFHFENDETKPQFDSYNYQSSVGMSTSSDHFYEATPSISNQNNSDNFHVCDDLFHSTSTDLKTEIEPSASSSSATRLDSGTDQNIYINHVEQEESPIEVKFHPEGTLEEIDEINALDLAKGIKRMAYACKLTHLIKKADGIIADPDLQNRIVTAHFSLIVDGTVGKWKRDGLLTDVNGHMLLVEVLNLFCVCVLFDSNAKSLKSIQKETEEVIEKLRNEKDEKMISVANICECLDTLLQFAASS
ncbi:hypothetical protein GCK72_019727 [Caenorhabditis remanei]|uniref:SPK domain-containing protein n=1 Tax=Caenorhabditis remanei TaxID=31234 RepID=A0A6A5GF09_CAERE|nr:hypothetical protein GCK72_019727 [Caenorhabditis remanei]KAF1753171.1 hypothetical protein GCK72_019727 [Caenorhabditis remanei]